MNQSKGKVVSAFSWKFFERLSVQGASFLVTLILARLLTPDDYGVIALITVFISLANTFVQGGFNTALIQKKNATQEDFFSVTVFTLFVAILLYIILFVSAPGLARFYAMPEITSIVRVMALLLIPAAINSVQVAYVTKDLRFKVLSASSLISTGLAAIIGISMAYCGSGAWALVAQQISIQLFSCISILFLTKWSPKGKFSAKSIRELIPYGSRILCANLLVTLFLNLRSMIIGRLYSSEALGFFNRGKQFPQAVMESINGTIQSVLLPVYANEQDHRQKMLKMVRLSIQVSSYIIFPMMIGLACVAPALVELLLTEKWLPCVPFLQLFAFSYMCQPAQLSTAQAYRAIGDSKTTLHLEFVRKIAEIVLLVISLRHGTVAIAFSSVVAGVVALTMAFAPNVRILHYTISEQLADLLPSLTMSVVMGVIVLWIGRVNLSVWLQLLLQIFGGVAVYFLLSLIFKPKAFTFLLKILMKQQN